MDTQHGNLLLPVYQEQNLSQYLRNTYWYVGIAQADNKLYGWQISRIWNVVAGKSLARCIPLAQSPQTCPYSAQDCRGPVLVPWQWCHGSSASTATFRFSSWMRTGSDCWFCLMDLIVLQSYSMQQWLFYLRDVMYSLLIACFEANLPFNWCFSTSVSRRNHQLVRNVRFYLVVVWCACVIRITDCHETWKPAQLTESPEAALEQLPHEIRASSMQIGNFQLCMPYVATVQTNVMTKHMAWWWLSTQHLQLSPEASQFEQRQCKLWFTGTLPT